MKNKNQSIRIQFFHRKIRNQPAVKTTIFAEREDGSSHSKAFITHGDIAKAKRVAKSQANIFLMNITRNASLVEIS